MFVCFLGILERTSPWGLCASPSAPQHHHEGFTFLYSTNATGRWGCQTFQLTVWPEVAKTQKVCVLFMRQSMVRPSGAGHKWENPLQVEELWGKCASQKTWQKECLDFSPVILQEWPTVQGAHGQNYHANKLGSVEEAASPLRLQRDSSRLFWGNSHGMDGITLGD